MTDGINNTNIPDIVIQNMIIGIIAQLSEYLLHNDAYSCSVSFENVRSGLTGIKAV